MASKRTKKVSTPKKPSMGAKLQRAIEVAEYAVQERQSASDRLVEANRKATRLQGEVSRLQQQKMQLLRFARFVSQANNILVSSAFDEPDISWALGTPGVGKSTLASDE